MNFEQNINYIDNDINLEVKTRNDAINYLKDLKSRLTKEGLDQREKLKDEPRREELTKLITYKSSLRDDREENERIINEINTMINYLKESMVEEVRSENIISQEEETELKEAA